MAPGPSYPNCNFAEDGNCSCCQIHQANTTNRQSNSQQGPTAETERLHLEPVHWSILASQEKRARRAERLHLEPVHWSILASQEKRARRGRISTRKISLSRSGPWPRQACRRLMRSRLFTQAVGEIRGQKEVKRWKKEKERKQARLTLFQWTALQLPFMNSWDEWDSSCDEDATTCSLRKGENALDSVGLLLHFTKMSTLCSR